MTEWEKYYKILMYKNTSLKPNLNNFKNTDYIRKVKHMEHWWNISIVATAKVPYNKPDLIFWNLEKVSALASTLAAH